jgi:hypothetical protein
MKAIWHVLMIILFLMGSCTKDQDTAPLGLSQEFTLKIGDIRSSKSDNLSIKVLEVNDSRCPTGVECFWAGMVAVKLEVTENSVFEVMLDSMGHRSDTVNNLIFKLIDVLPYPKWGVEVPDSEKKVVLKIDKI